VISRGTGLSQVFASTPLLSQGFTGRVQFNFGIQDKNKKRLMRLALNEFLRRFFLHVLPKGFVRIRHFGLFAHRRRAASLPLCFALLKQTGGPQTLTDPAPTGAPRPLWLCPHCGGAMASVERFTASQARLRAPPAKREQL
jgi:hypothetical protein